MSGDGDSDSGGSSQGLTDAVSEIRDDREHGASWLARRAAEALLAATRDLPATEAQIRLAAIHRGARMLAEVRPSMAALTNTVARIWSAAASTTAGEAATRLSAIHTAAGATVATWDESTRAIAEAARPLLTPVICTHSRSGTVEAVLRQYAADEPSGMPRDLIVGEGRPGGEGVALARTLARSGWRVTLIADAAYGLFLMNAGVVLVGADSVRSDGSVINKVGTFPLALVAREAGVPFYVACETLKIAPQDLPLHLEEMEPCELLPEPVEGVTVRNVYFDRTPADLVAGIVTERGILTTEQVASFAREAGSALALLRAV